MPAIALALAAFPAWAVNIVIDPNFSSPVNSYPGYGPVTGWNSSSIESGNNTMGEPFWDNGQAPAGISTVGFIQVSDSSTTDSLSQVLSLVVGDEYELDFAENARDSSQFPETEVLLDNTVLLGPSVQNSVDAPGVYTDSFTMASVGFTATASSQTLEFLATEQGPGQDASWLVTDVSVVATPEPGSASLISLALSACFIAGSRLRRRVAK